MASPAMNDMSYEETIDSKNARNYTTDRPSRIDNHFQLPHARRTTHRSPVHLEQSPATREKGNRVDVEAKLPPWTNDLVSA